MNLGLLENRLRRHVEKLAQKPRISGSVEHRQAADYILDHLRKAGFRAQEAPLEEAGFTALNLETWSIPDDNSLPLLIVGAHYDTVSGSPGADDNASGIAALLELAGWIHPRLTARGLHRCRLQLMAYDLEESGIVGSWLHCRQLDRAGAQIRAMISLEMLGFTAAEQHLPGHLSGRYPEVGDFIGICGNTASQEVLAEVTEAMMLTEGLPVEFIVVHGKGEVLPEARLSDHSPFWDRGYQALMITDTSFFRNPHYHKLSDLPSTLDYPFLAKVTWGVCQAVEKLVLG